MTSKLIAIGLAVMVAAVGGAAAATGSGLQATDDPGLDSSTNGEADIDASYANGTVTVSVTQGGEPVEGAFVEVADAERETDANGTVVVQSVDLEEELDIEVDAEGFEGEVSYVVADDSLVLQEEEYEYEVPERDGDHDEDADETEEDDNEDADDETEEDEYEDGDDETEEDEYEEGDDETEEDDNEDADDEAEEDDDDQEDAEDDE